MSSEERKQKTAALIAETREIQGHEITRSKLDQISARLLELATARHLWTDDAYPSPPEGQEQNRYLVDAEDSDGGISLYLNVVRSGKTVPPHNHTTWACIAAVEGVEHNMFYTRTDDGSAAGKASLRLDRTLAVGPGDVIAMMPDDIHNFEVRGDQIIRHLHFYGRPLETLSERLSFDMEAGTCKIMDIGVKTIT